MTTQHAVAQFRVSSDDGSVTSTFGIATQAVLYAYRLAETFPQVTVYRGDAVLVRMVREVDNAHPCWQD